MATRKEIELIPISNKFVKTGGYLARIKNRYVLEYDEVLDEVVEESGLRLNRDNLRLILDSTFNTIIRNTLRDGNCRRVGNYFTLQLEVNGKFDGPGDQFDPEKHKLSLVLRPLKELRLCESGREHGIRFRPHGGHIGQSVRHAHHDQLGEGV